MTIIINKLWKLSRKITHRWEFENVVTGIEKLVLEISILTNIKKKKILIIKKHEKKLKSLSKNFTQPFISDEVITHLSSYQLSDKEEDLLKYRLLYVIPSKSSNKTDIFTTLEKLNLCVAWKNTKDTEMLQAELS